MTVASVRRIKQPTVCYLTKRFPRLSETFILDEILGLEAAGIDLRLFAIADPCEPEVQPDVRRVRSRVSYLRSGHGAWTAASDYSRFLRGHLTMLRRCPRRWTRAAAQVIRHGRSLAMAKHFVEAGGMAVELDGIGGDHIHAAFAHGPASVAFYVHLLTGRPFSFAAHAKDLYLSTPEVLAMKIRSATFVLACSESAANELRRIVDLQAGGSPDRNIDKVVYAPHGVDISRFRPAPNDPLVDVPADPLRLLAVGRLVPKKGYPALLQSLATLVGKGVDFQCRIVGSGSQRSELEALAAGLGLEGRVTFCGALTQQEIIREYQGADVFLQASVITGDGDRDGIPNSVLEAMACGMPVVATAVAGIPEVVRDHETGLLVAPGRPALMTEALEELVDDALLRAQLGAAARHFVEVNLSRSICVEVPAALFQGRQSVGTKASGVSA